MQDSTQLQSLEATQHDGSIGRIVSVTGSRAIVMLDPAEDGAQRDANDRPEMGTLLAIDTANTVVLCIVSALSVPVPANRDSDEEIWIAELGLVGELWKNGEGEITSFKRGTTFYPALGDRVRVATKHELKMSFIGTGERSVSVGTIRQDSTIEAKVRVDDLLGKHFAILGTTGTGKSCTTALILRSILEEHPNAHIVLLDPHNEYATAFKEYAEVINPRNMQLPLWLLNFEEAVEVLVGDPTRKAEIEILQELIPAAKQRYGAGRGAEQKLRRSRSDGGRYTVDTPVPYRISDLMGMIDERMGMLENKKDLTPYRNLKTRIETISHDGRYAFMFGSLTVYDGMAQILSRIFRVPVQGKPITILELTGIPTEIVNVVVSVLCRMTFDFALWSEGQVPVTLVCEEAHRYVPLKSDLGFEPCKRAIAKIAKEGRKYGASLCIVTQRPAEIDPTILSQCNTVFALRMSNDRDQEIVTSAISDTGSGLLEFLPALGQREAIAFGDGVALPVRIKFRELDSNSLPRSSTAKFSEKWQTSVEDSGFLDHVVERWRSSNMNADDNEGAAVDGADPSAQSAPAPQPQTAAPAQHAATHAQPLGGQYPASAPAASRPQPAMAGAGAPAPRAPSEGLAAASRLRRTAATAQPSPPPAAPPPTTASSGNGQLASPEARANLRERLLKRS